MSEFLIKPKSIQIIAPGNVPMGLRFRTVGIGFSNASTATGDLTVLLGLGVSIPFSLPKAAPGYTGYSLYYDNIMPVEVTEFTLSNSLASGSAYLFLVEF